MFLKHRNLRKIRPILLTEENCRYPYAIGPSPHREHLRRMTPKCPKMHIIHKKETEKKRKNRHKKTKSPPLASRM